MDDTRATWVETHIDRIWDDRLDRMVTGARMSPTELASVMAMARDDLALSIRQQILSSVKPSEIKASVQTFCDLDHWLGDHDGGVAARARPVTPSEIDRVSRMLRDARGHRGA